MNLNKELMDAIDNIDYDRAATAIKNGADVDYMDQLPIRRAAIIGDITMFKLLLEKGADPFAGNNQPLKLAEYHNNVDIQQIILSKAYVNDVNKSRHTIVNGAKYKYKSFLNNLVFKQEISLGDLIQFILLTFILIMLF